MQIEVDENRVGVDANVDVDVVYEVDVDEVDKVDVVEVEDFVERLLSEFFVRV